MEKVKTIFFEEGGSDFMILAQYTIRSKQSYIFRSNKMREITGGSAIIGNAFKLLFDKARKCGLVAETVSDSEASGDFHLEDVKKRFEDHTLHMIELFSGGGNETVLYSDEQSFQQANRAYTCHLLKAYPGLIPLCVGIPVDGNPKGYKEDYASLMEAVEIEKNRMLPGSMMPMMPFSEMDRNTHLPIARKDKIYGAGRSAEGEITEVSRSAEAQAKYQAGSEKKKKEEDDSYYEDLLDEIVTEKGEESLLAIVHADGNNMGVKIQHLLDGHSDYNFCVSAMRKFTHNINDAFVNAGIAGIRKELEILKQEDMGRHPKCYKYRVIVSDGDDVTFVCNARFALALTKAYLKAVASYNTSCDTGENGQELYSSCAGICIFHSHYPFARAYELAEQACDSAKGPVHQSLPVPEEECWLDFHFLHSGVAGDLGEIRDRQDTAPCMARPWRVTGKGSFTGGSDFDISKWEETVNLWKSCGGSRTNIKTIGNSFEQSTADGVYELSRVYYRHTEMEEKLKGIFEDENRLYKALYDAGEMYDIWFGGKEPVRDEKNKNNIAQ